MTSTKSFSSISLHDDLIEKIDHLLEHLKENKIGTSYRGRAHFVETAVNELIEKTVRIFLNE